MILSLAAEFGVYATDQLSVRVDDLSEIDTAMAYIRTKTPGALLDDPVTGVDDLMPEADVVVLRTESARVVVRPSGTEPKLKAYLEVVRPATLTTLARDRTAAAEAVATLRDETAVALGLLGSV